MIEVANRKRCRVLPIPLHPTALTATSGHPDEANGERQDEKQARILNVALNSIQDFTYVFDQEGRFLYSNQPLLNLLDITLPEIIGKNFFDLGYPTDLATRLQAQIQSVFDTRAIVKDETPFVGAAGEEGFYEYIFTPVLSPPAV